VAFSSLGVFSGNHGAEGSDDELMSEINIVPFTDVMLVLLVIFMVTTPMFVMESFKIKLPKALSSSPELSGKGIMVTVGASGELIINDKAVPMNELYDVLKRELDGVVDKIVILKGDADASHGVVVKVLDTARRAGADKLSIATEREE
jgi:biopolymer transport protein ExbD